MYLLPYNQRKLLLLMRPPLTFPGNTRHKHEIISPKRRFNKKLRVYYVFCWPGFKGEMHIAYNILHITCVYKQTTAYVVISSCNTFKRLMQYKSSTIYVHSSCNIYQNIKKFQVF